MNWYPLFLRGHNAGNLTKFFLYVNLIKPLAIVRAIQTGQTPSPNFFDGVQAQKVLQALLISWEKKEWVDLI